jgi:hypothetical protein
MGRQQTPCFLFLLLISELKLRVGGVIITALFPIQDLLCGRPANEFSDACCKETAQETPKANLELCA